MVWMNEQETQRPRSFIHRMRWVFAILLVLGIAGTPGAAWAQAYAWNMDPPMVDYGPQWNKVETLWAGHYGGKNLDELLRALAPLKDKYPNRIEPYLWLARVNYLHARYKSSDQAAYFAKSETYAAQALKMDPKNTLALKYLVDTLAYSRDRAYIFNRYGALIKAEAPLPISDALPDLQNIAGWETFKPLWQARVDIREAESAVAMMEKMARAHPEDAEVQTWAARAEYYVGEYYTLHGEHETKGMPYYRKGIAYAERALKLAPKSVTANYWYQINVARSLEMTSIFTKALHLMDLLSPLLYCSRENSLYYFSGPVLCLEGMITHGGWVAEKGMAWSGITLEMEMNGLVLSEIAYPDYFYIPYAHADILAYKGKKKEAMAILEKLITRDPDVSPLIPENYSFLRAARALYSDLQQGKR
jgi:tetratricopeptide (TPR) repeat protein